MVAPQLPYGPDRLRLIASIERSHFWFVARHLLVDRLIDLALYPSATMAVDVGCGTGLLAERLASRGLRVLALDIYLHGLTRLRAVNPGVWVALAQASQLPVASHTFDTAVVLDVLEHTDDELALREIVRVLKPGGTVVVTVPAMPWLWSARDEVAGHQRRYTRRGVIQLLRDADLHVEHVRFYQCLLLPALVVTRLLGRRWARTLQAEERPADWFNRLCLAINRFEVRAGDYVAWPWGSSLAAVGRKPA